MENGEWRMENGLFKQLNPLLFKELKLGRN